MSKPTPPSAPTQAPHGAPSYLIWTRSQTDWATDAGLVQSLGVPYLHLPCVALRTLPRKAGEEVALEQAFVPGKRSVVVFTSAHAVHCALADELWARCLQRALPSTLYAIGEGTRAALAAYGHNATVPLGVRTGQELAHYLLTAERRDPSLLFVLPGPRQRAFDLAGTLGAAGYHCLSIDLYETHQGLTHPPGHMAAGIDLSAEEKTMFLQAYRGVVCFASPSAVVGFASGVPTPLLQTHYFAACIGPTTALACEPYFPSLAIARQADLRALAEVALEAYKILSFQDKNKGF